MNLVAAILAPTRPAHAQYRRQAYLRCGRPTVPAARGGAVVARGKTASERSRLAARRPDFWCHGRLAVVVGADVTFGPCGGWRLGVQTRRAPTFTELVMANLPVTSITPA